MKQFMMGYEKLDEEGTRSVGMECIGIEPHLALDRTIHPR